jgi:aminopeptidase N
VPGEQVPDEVEERVPFAPVEVHARPLPGLVPEVEEVGTDAFWAGIRDYYKRYRDGNATTEDLRQVMEKQSGKDLAWFFKQWLRRPGSPVIDGAWHYDAVTKKVVVRLTQKQPGDAYRLLLEVGISREGAAPKVVSIELTKTQ